MAGVWVLILMVYPVIGEQGQYGLQGIVTGTGIITFAQRCKSVIARFFNCFPVRNVHLSEADRLRLPLGSNQLHVNDVATTDIRYPRGLLRTEGHHDTLSWLQPFRHAGAFPPLYS